MFIKNICDKFIKFMQTNKNKMSREVGEIESLEEAWYVSGLVGGQVEGR